MAADRAELKNYELLVIPEPNDFLTNMIQRMSGKDERSTDLATPAPMVSLSQLRDVRQAIYSLRQVDPARADTFLHGLQCVDLIQRYGVALMMSHQIVWTIPRLLASEPR